MRIATDPRIHKDANCRYRDERTYIDIIYDLIKVDVLESIALLSINLFLESSLSQAGWLMFSFYLKIFEKCSESFLSFAIMLDQAHDIQVGQHPF